MGFKPVLELPTGRGFADFVFIPKPEFNRTLQEFPHPLQVAG